jgi:hypothetical protein
MNHAEQRSTGESVTRMVRRRFTDIIETKVIDEKK